MVRAVVQFGMALVLGTLAAGVGGCAGEQHAAFIVSATPIVAAEEVWGLAGHAVAVPLATGRVSPTTERVRVTRPDGSGAEAPVWWVGRSAQDGGAGWLGVVWKWSARTAASSTGVTDGESAWAVIPPAMTADLVGAGGRWRIGDSTVRIRLIEGRAYNDAQTRFEADRGDEEVLRAVLQPSLASPFTAWRARLVLGSDDALEGTDVISVIEATETGLWMTALDRLKSIDTKLAQSVMRRLTSVVDFGFDTRLPLWVQSGPALAQLRAELLAEDMTADQRAARARAWLDAQPPAAAWICDDGGLRDAGTGEPACTVAFVNLSDRPVSVSAVIDGDRNAHATASAPELMVVEPLSAAKLHIPGPTGLQSRDRAVIVRAGGWVKRLPVLCDEIAARPPGVPIGPFLLELSCEMAAIATEQGQSLLPAARPVSAAWATAGLLMREPLQRDASVASPPDDREAVWTIYLECAHPRSEPIEHDSVRILLGPSDGSAGAREIVVDLITAESAAQPVPGVRIVRGEDRWMCWVRVPGDAIERDARLRLGLVRESTPRAGSASVVSSWPRPMMPGSVNDEHGPGRLCIDLTRWTSVGGER